MNSEAYTDFKAQLKVVGRQRMEGYDPNLFDKITEQERSEVEKDLKYQTKITEDAVNDLENGLTEEEKEKAVRKYYRYLWPGGRGGLSDVVLWDEDLEKKIALNEPLDRICRELKKLIDEEQRLSG